MTSTVVLITSIIAIVAIAGETVDFKSKFEKDFPGNREQQRALHQMSDGDSRHGSVMDLVSYGLPSNLNGKDSTSTATTDKNTKWLSPPLKIKHLQLRRRRSNLGVMSPSKTDVTMLAGSNPFALILANRVYNNNTSSIKPLGLWNQIVRLFNR